MSAATPPPTAPAMSPVLVPLPFAATEGATTPWTCMPGTAPERNVVAVDGELRELEREVDMEVAAASEGALIEMPSLTLAAETVTVT